MVDPYRPQMAIIRRTRFACWITKAADTLRIYKTAFPQQKSLRERALMFLYTYTACLVIFTSVFTITTHTLYQGAS